LANALEASRNSYFGVVRQHIDQLAQQGVIERRPDGLFDQGVSRLK